jgi:hypothetical protein
MPQNKPLSVSELTLDLTNFRTVPQPTELQAVKAMVSISPDWFWALTDSLLTDGYLPTENIIVLEQGAELIVKEGNRRIAALKLIHGQIPTMPLDIPKPLLLRIDGVAQAWKDANLEVPCAVFPASAAAVVDRIVTLAHGKGEKAGRDDWNAVARARHSRNMNSASEPALDLLEKYLENGENLTSQQATLWAGEYPLSVLEEAMKKIAARVGEQSAADLAKIYPQTPYRAAIDDILHHIGLQVIRFEVIRDKKADFASKYGVPVANAPTSPVGQNPAPATASAPPSAPAATGAQGGGPGGPPAPAPTGAVAPLPPRKVAAAPTNDPRAVMRVLRKFRPVGPQREKVATLRVEATKLSLEKNPIAFCFLLRSMFEISAKAYCDDHAASGGPKAKKNDGTDRRLVDVLRDVTAHLTKNSTDQAMMKELHGAMTELATSDSILSVTSMNQLVHHPSFSVTAQNISTLFFNVFPLLAAMNR